MKKSFASLVLGLGLLGTAATARADGGWYAAFDLGGSRLGNVPQGGGDDTGTGYQLVGGREMNPNLALEAGFVNFGKGTADLCVLIAIPCGTGQTADVRAEALSFDGIGKFPLNESFSLFARFGVDTGQVHESFHGTNSINSGFNWGFGAAYHFDASWGLRAQFAQFQSLGDAGTTGSGNFRLVSLGVSYSFH